MPEDGPAKIGTMLEELAARFDLVVEAVTGFGGKLQSLRDEIFAQFAEVGGQVRFLSEQIAENRRGIGATKSDLGAEMVRLGEMLGRTRVEIREQMTATQDGLGRKLDASASAADRLHDEAAAAAELSRGIRREVTATAETTVKRIGVDLKQTQKALAALLHKFERFDDRLTIQARDQDQRIRKLERKRSA